MKATSLVSLRLNKLAGATSASIWQMGMKSCYSRQVVYMKLGDCLRQTASAMWFFPMSDDGEKHVPRASQFVVEEHLGAHMPAPPFDRRVDIARKQMNVVEIERHGSLSGDTSIRR